MKGLKPWKFFGGEPAVNADGPLRSPRSDDEPPGSPPDDDPRAPAFHSFEHR